ILLIVLITLLSWGFSFPVKADINTEQTPQVIEPYLAGFKKRITQFRLKNGIEFIVLENHKAPVVSFVTYANVGGVEEPEGKTGVAHFLEHLAFKGTDKIGTINYPAEKKLLDRLDQIFEQIKAAKAQGNKERIASLEQEFQKLQSKAQKLVKQNEFGQIVETAGGVGINAATSYDYTMYYYSFPANKVELWMSLESERFLKPVFREFYVEKQVILEERRLRNDNSPIGKMIEAFLATAFTTHPYKRPVIGYEEDINNLTRRDVQEFFDTYYIPANLTIAIAGDVQPAKIKQLAEVYFGRFTTKPQPEVDIPSEPPQTEMREVSLTLPAQPWYLEGYHRPALNHPDNAVYSVMTTILSSGRTSRLYKSLVEQQQLALSAQGSTNFPGDKYPNLMLFYALTAPNHTVEEVATALQTEIDKLKNELVSETELTRAKRQIQADVLRNLDSNLGMARLLAQYQAKTGDWRQIFTELEAISQVTAADIQRVAQTTFTAENRTVGKLLSSAK
ncbi:MAG: insulinase family protein, partial [Cyanobacteria bacterium J083]